MSRRTKLTILGVFLALSGIALIGGVYSWRPKNPLRITLPPNQKENPEVPISGYYLPPYEIVVENTCDTWIHLYGARLDDASPAARSRFPLAVVAEPDWTRGKSAMPGTPWLIPPHSSIRCTVLPFGPGDLPAAQSGRLEVKYAWCSSLNHRYTQLREWLRKHCPQRLQEFLGEPDYFENSTPLEVQVPPQHPPI
jgi:hypothetical protein